ncbi:MAG: hypothetical protein EPO11_03740, partial [Gammaproteobacteria bacterium]
KLAELEKELAAKNALLDELEPRRQGLELKIEIDNDEKLQAEKLKEKSSINQKILLLVNEMHSIFYSIEREKNEIKKIEDKICQLDVLREKLTIVKSTYQLKLEQIAIEVTLIKRLEDEIKTLIKEIKAENNLAWRTEMFIKCLAESQMMSHKKIKNRVKVISFWSSVAQRLFETRCFHAAIAIISAFDNMVDLPETMAALPVNVKEIIKQISLMKSAKTFLHVVSNIEQTSFIPPYSTFPAMLEKLNEDIGNYIEVLHDRKRSEEEKRNAREMVEFSKELAQQFLVILHACVEQAKKIALDGRVSLNLNVNGAEMANFLYEKYKKLKKTEKYYREKENNTQPIILDELLKIRCDLQEVRNERGSELARLAYKKYIGNQEISGKILKTTDKNPEEINNKIEIQGEMIEKEIIAKKISPHLAPTSNIGELEKAKADLCQYQRIVKKEIDLIKADEAAIHRKRTGKQVYFPDQKLKQEEAAIKRKSIFSLPMSRHKVDALPLKENTEVSVAEFKPEKQSSSQDRRPHSLCVTSKERDKLFSQDRKGKNKIPEIDDSPYISKRMSNI